MSKSKDTQDDDVPELRLEIDPLRLDDEWVDQPRTYHAWAVRAADAQAAFDRAKSELDLVTADLGKQIRDNPQEFGLAKVTEGSIEEAIKTQSIYAHAVEDMNERRHAMGIAQAAVQALDHRKRALSMLVELWVRDYYSRPHDDAPTEAGEAYRKQVARTRGRRRVAAIDDIDRPDVGD